MHFKVNQWIVNELLQDRVYLMPRKEIGRCYSPTKCVIFMLFAACLIVGCTVKGEKESYIKEIPHKSAVGAANLPDIIAPVKAPFEMPEFNKPEFPDFTVKIPEAGANSGKTITKTIQRAIDSVSNKRRRESINTCRQMEDRPDQS